MDEDSDEEPLPLHDESTHDPIYDEPPRRTSKVDEDSDEEPLPLLDETTHDPIYDEPPRNLDLIYDDNGTNNPTYGVQLSGEHSFSGAHSEQLTQ